MVLEMAAAALAVCALWQFWELRQRRLRDRSCFVFSFPRQVTPAWSSADDTLARLAYDYGLSDSEVEHIVREGIHDAVRQYRRDHPVGRPPSDDIDFVNVFPLE